MRLGVWGGVPGVVRAVSERKPGVCRGLREALNPA